MQTIIHNQSDFLNTYSMAAQIKGSILLLITKSTTGHNAEWLLKTFHMWSAAFTAHFKVQPQHSQRDRGKPDTIWSRTAITSVIQSEDVKNTEQMC